MRFPSLLASALNQMVAAKITFTFLAVFLSAHTAFGLPKNLDGCGGYLEAAKSADSDAHALEQIMIELPRLFAQADLERFEWYQTLKTFVLPAQRTDSSLLVASIIGGGNSGKSTLANALPGLLQDRPDMGLNQPISATGIQAGMTRQMVLSLPDSDPEGLYSRDISERFGPLTVWTSPSDALKAGSGVLVHRTGMPSRIAFIDAPDFDSGEASQEMPDNFAEAMRVICPSDVLIGIFNLSTYRNQAMIKTLRRIFQTYGAKKMILIFQIDAVVDRGEVTTLLKELAHQIYAGPLQPSGFPEPVLGAYIMPSSANVFMNRQNPELVALGGYPGFRSLIESVNENSRALHQSSIESAKQVALAQLREALRERAKSLLTAELYRDGALAAIESAARKHLQPFPFASAAAHVRKKFQTYRSEFDQVLHRTAQAMGFPWRPAIDFFQKLTPAPFKSVDLEPALREDHDVHDRLSITDLFLQLQEQAVTLVEGSAVAQRFAERSRAFYQLFPEEFEHEAEPGGTIRIRFPALRLLPGKLHDHWQMLLNTDTENLRVQLGKVIGAAQFATPETASAQSPQVDQVVQDVMGKGRWSRHLVLRTLDLSAVGLPLLGVGALVFEGINSWILWGATIIAPAYMMSMANQNLTDRILKTELNSWFYRLQFELTEEFLRQNVLSDFEEARLNATSESLQVLQNLQDLLHTLVPTATPIPTTFDQK